MSFADNLPLAHRLGEDRVKNLLVIPTADLVLKFYEALGGTHLPRKDVEEILTQITWTLLDAKPTEDVDGKLMQLPDVERLVYFNRIEHRELLARGEQFASFQRAVHTLAFAVRDRLVELGAYKDKEFPYYLDSLISLDVVLSKFPF